MPDEESLPQKESDVNPQIQTSLRTDEANAINRQILSEAMMDVAQTKLEKDRLTEYQGIIQKISENERRLSKVTEEMRQLQSTKGKGSRDMEAIRALRNEKINLENAITNADRTLISLQAAKPIQNILSRSKAEYERIATQRRQEAVAAQRQADTERYNKKIADIKDKIQKRVTDYKRKLSAQEAEYRRKLAKQEKKYKSKCTIHFIRDVVLEKIVLEAVSDLADFVRIYEPVFTYLIARREQDNRTGNLKELKDNLEAWKKRMKAIDKAISTLFEANMEGKISDGRFMKMTADYESEQKELESMVSKAEKDLKEAEQNKVDLRLLLKALREYSEIKELTPALVNKLIQRIEVHNNDKSSGHCHVQVDIYFTGIGMMNLPTEHELMKLLDEYKSEHKSLITTA